jgi:hypothetical protein
MSNAGRKPIAAATTVESNADHQAIATAATAADQMSVLQASYGQERDLANQLLGQIQMSRAISKFTDVVSLQKLKYIKENKSYRALSGQKGVDRHGNEIPDVGTFDGFCRALGTSASKVDEDLTNLQAFGEDALAQLTQAGAGYRELRQYRKLPEDQKLALIEVAQAGDKESFVELAEEIIAKHAKEKEALSAQVQEHQETIEAKDRVLASNSERITSLEEKTARVFKPRPGSEARTADEELLLDEIQEATAASLHGLRRLFTAADAAIIGSERDAIQLAARQGVEYLCQQLVDIAAEFNISVDLEERLQPSWMSPEALAAMEQRQAERDAAEK